MSDRYEGQSYYDILEIQPTAGTNDIYKAYQRAKVAYSPTSPALYTMFTAAEAQELMVLIEEAYQTLSHQARRKDYDIKMGYVQAPSKPDTLYRPESIFKSAKVTPAEKKTVSPEASAAGIGPVVVQKKKDDVPSGYGRTKFGVYELRNEMEDEIKNVGECDGDFLRKVRLYKGVSLEQLADEIRATKTTMNAIETNELNTLPVAVFTRGFVIQICRALGLDEKRVTDAYMKFFRSKKSV